MPALSSSTGCCKHAIRHVNAHGERLTAVSTFGVRGDGQWGKLGEGSVVGGATNLGRGA